MKISIFGEIICRTPSRSIEILQNSDPEFLSILGENDPEFLYSIYLSSPELYQQIKNNKEKSQKLRLTIIKYYIRSCYRTIPFGTFSGIGLIKYNTKSDGKIELLNFSSKSVVDYSFLVNILKFENGSSNYYLNPTCFKSKNGLIYKYIEFQKDKLANNFQYNVINNNYYVDSILKKSKNGITETEIYTYLEDEGFAHNEIESFANELINSNLLVNTLTSSIMVPSNKSNDFLLQLQNEIDEIDKIKDYQDKILEHIRLKEHLGSKSNYSGNFLYTNLFCEFNGGFSHSQKKIIDESIIFLDELLSRFPSVKMDNFSNFIKDFENRYEEESISLLEVLNPDSGINYIEEVISEKTDWCFLDDYFCEKIYKNIEKSTIDINDREVLQIKNTNIKQNVTKSPTGNARINMYKNKGEEMVYIRSLCSNTPIRIISRFAHIDDNINSLCEEISAYEKESFNNVILSEVDYLPSSTIGNLVVRNNYRDFKIAFDSYDGSLDTLPVNDLYLKIIDGELILFSKTLKKQILPYFSNTLTTENNENIPLVFRFLINYNSYYLNRKIGTLNILKYHTYYKHIPRIMYKNKIILSRESWLILEKDFFINGNGTQLTFEEAIENFNAKKENLKIPEIFDIIIDDIETFIDSSKEFYVHIFLTELKKHKRLIVTESLASKYDSVIKKDLLNYNNEMFVPFKNLDFKPRIKLSQNFLTKNNKISRFFLPGSEWMYYKIYLKPGYSDKFLKFIFNKLMRLLKIKKISYFYYLRFIEDGFHIRLRVKLSDRKYYGEVSQYFEKIINQLYNDSLIEKIMMNTYTREIERYGEKNIEIIEEVFNIDSILSLKLLENSNLTENWMKSIGVVDLYLNFFFTDDLNEKIQFINHMKKVIFRDINGNKDTTAFLNRSYSENKDIIDDSLKLCFEIEEYAPKLYSLLDQLKFSEAREEYYYASNIIHMHITRLVNESNKLYELLVYDILLKKYNTAKYTQN